MSGFSWRAIDPEQTLYPDFVLLLNGRMRQLAAAVSALIGSTVSVKTFLNSATTPGVAAGKIFIVSNTVGTTITTFKDGGAGQEFLLWATTANTTIQHSAAVGGILMKGGANVTMTATETRRFATVDGISWRES